MEVISALHVKVKVKSLSHVQLLVTPSTVAYQAPPSMGFTRKEYWGGLPFPSLLLCMRVFQIQCGGMSNAGELTREALSWETLGSQR